MGAHKGREIEVMFQPLDKKRYSDEIANLIQKRIPTQNLADGAKLPGERQLAEELVVSRSCRKGSTPYARCLGAREHQEGASREHLASLDWR